MLTFIQPCSIKTTLKKIAALVGFFLLVVNDVSTYGLPHNIVMEEIWKPIYGYENYLISSLGNVKTLKRDTKGKNNSLVVRKERLIRPQTHNYEYLTITLYKNKTFKMHRVHRLVCAAFHPNPENKPLVNHINGIKWDNRAVNLEWSTHSENIQHFYINNKPKSGLHKKSTKNIYLNVCNGIYYSERELSELYKHSRLTIKRLVRKNKIPNIQKV